MKTGRAGRLGCLLKALYLAFVMLVTTGTPAVSAQAPPNSSDTFEALSARADALREAGNGAEAVTYYQSALKLRPDWAEGWWYVGTILYDADRYADAIPAFKKLLNLNPEFGPALCFLGLSEFEIKDYKNSLAHLQQADLQGYGDDLDLARVAKYHLAMLLNWSGDFDKAFTVLANAFGGRKMPDSLKTTIGMAILRIPLLPNEVDPGEDALINAAGEAGELMIAGKSEQAADAFRQLITEDPKTPYLHYAYAIALSQANKNDEALTQLVEETKITTESALPYEKMATIQLEQHHPKLALVSAQRAIRLAPQSAASHEVLSKALQELGRTVEAKQELATSKKLKNSSSQIDHRQQQLYARSAEPEKQTPKSTAAAKSAGPPNSDAQAQFEMLSQRAETARREGRFEDAIADFESSLALRKDWAEGWQNLGTMYYASGRYSDAVKALQKNLALSPRNGTAWALLGLSEFETKDYKNALIHLKRGHDLGLSGNASAVQVARYHLALLLNRKGEFDEATELLTPDSGSGPTNDATRIALGIALLRMRVLPQEIPASEVPLVQGAGKAAAFLVESKYDEAFSQLKQLIKEYPNTPYLHYAYGSALMSASQYYEAEQELAEETKLTPQNALPYRRRATVALQMRRPEIALQFAQKAVQLDSESAEGHYLLGRSLLELGKTTESVRQLEKARELAPNSPEVHFILARAYAKSGQAEAAGKERSTFERLNAEVQRQRSHTGSQAYGAHQTESGLHAAEANPNQTSQQPQ